MRTQLFLTFCTLLLTSFGFAQNTITGTVTDAEGAPLPGVNILEKGTTNGTVTDFDGNYSLEIDGDAILVFSYIGFNTEEISSEGKTVINLSMSEGVLLDE